LFDDKIQQLCCWICPSASKVFAIERHICAGFSIERGRMLRETKKRLQNEDCVISLYKQKIHEAVVAGGTHDYYTGLPLDWSLINTLTMN
jgi:hypothetical protein